MKILLATRNKDKIFEIKQILSGLDIEFMTSYDFPELPEVIEDKDTLEGNALKKAMESASFTNMATLADDTGLFVEALNGDPGVYSARFAGEDCTYRDNRVKMLDMMKNESNRKAQFRTVVAFVSPEGILGTAEGTVKGSITETEIGKGGFGYDAIFKADETGRTFGEMTDSEKNLISHRARAFNNIIPKIKEVIKTSG